MRRSALWLGLLLVAGFIVRQWAMRWPPFPYDMDLWIYWGERVREVGPRNFYSPDVFADYAPGYIYVMWLTAAIKHAFFPAASEGVYHLLYRLPPIVCDLLVAALIYGVIQREMSKQQPSIDRWWLPLLGAGIHLFNPLVIFNGAIWGQIDATFTFAMLLALVLALRNRPIIAVLVYVIAFLIKPQAIALAPLLAVLLLMRYSWRRWLPAGIAGVALGFVILVPFLGWGSYLSLIALLRKSVDVYPYTSMFSYNLWGISGFWEDDQARSFLGMSLRSLGTLMYLVGIAYGMALFVYVLRRGYNTVFASFAFATYFIFLPVMVLTRMHERYLYPIFPFLLIFALLCLLQFGVEQRARSIGWLPLGLYVGLSVLHTFNLYQVYTYYIHYDSGGVPRSNTFYFFVERNTELWSILTVAGFVVMAGVPLWLATRHYRDEVRRMPENSVGA